MVADKEAHVSSPLVQHQQQVAGLLRDPAAVGVGGHPGEMDPAGVEFHEAQHLQPWQPHRLHDEEVARDHPGGLLAEERLPAAARTPRCRVESVTAKRCADRGCRHAHTKAEQLALDALVAPARVLASEADDQVVDVAVQLRPAGLAVG